MKSPIVDVLAILICILAVVVIGQYYIAKKDKENRLHAFEKRLESRVDLKGVDMNKFESAVKHTE